MFFLREEIADIGLHYARNLGCKFWHAECLAGHSAAKDRQYESFFGFYTIVPKVGTYTGAYNFSKISDSYLAVFGAVLNDTALTDIGADTSSPYGIRLHSYDDVGCTYDDDDCAIGKKRHPYQNGFYINTSFQGGVKRRKINMRK